MQSVSFDIVLLAAAQKSAIIQIIGKLIEIIASKRVQAVPTDLDWRIPVGPGAQLGMPAR